jgi:hypothetical protein
MRIVDARFIVRDANGALTYVYFEGELDCRSAAHLLTRDEARRIAVNSPRGRTQRSYRTQSRAAAVTTAALLRTRPVPHARSSMPW